MAVLILVGGVVGACIWVLLIRLFPGPGPRRTASTEAWEAHEQKMRQRGGPFMVLLCTLILVIPLFELAGVAVKAFVLSAGGGYIAAFVVSAGSRVVKGRRI